jgi:Ca2+-binding EF-hand superfamily protein
LNFHKAYKDPQKRTVVYEGYKSGDFDFNGHWVLNKKSDSDSVFSGIFSMRKYCQESEDFAKVQSEVVRVMFQQYDHDLSGGLSVKEFAELSSHLLGKELSEEEVILAVRYLDQKATGEISFASFVALYPSIAHGSFPINSNNLTLCRIARQLFDFCDVDGNGVITLTEFEHLEEALTRVGFVASGTKKEELLDAIDVDHSATITYHEFVNFLIRCNAPAGVKMEDLERPVDRKEGVHEVVMDELHQACLIRAIIKDVDFYDVKHWVSCAVKLDAIDGEGETPLHHAVKVSVVDFRTVDCLLNHNPKLVNCRNSNQDTLLHLCARNGKAELAKHLRDVWRADGRLKNLHGLTPLEVAQDQKQFAVVEVLSK